VADTVAIARYFGDSLSPKAREAFQEAEDGKAMVLVPEIVLGEFACSTERTAEDERSEGYGNFLARPTLQATSSLCRWLKMPGTDFLKVKFESCMPG